MTRNRPRHLIRPRMVRPGDDRRTVGLALVAALVALGLTMSLMPAASAIPQPGDIGGEDWNASWDSGDPWPPAATAGWPVPATNPTLTARCGIDIGVIVDRSGSIADAGQATSYRDGVKDLDRRLRRHALQARRVVVRHRRQRHERRDLPLAPDGATSTAPRRPTSPA